MKKKKREVLIYLMYREQCEKNVLVIPLCSCSSPFTLWRKSSNISRKISGPHGQCRVSSDSDLAFLQLVLLSKSAAAPSSPWSQSHYGDLICCSCCCCGTFPFSASTHAAPGFCFGLGSALLSVILQHLLSSQTQRAKVVTFQVLVELGRGKSASDTGGVCGSTCHGGDL